MPEGLATSRLQLTVEADTTQLVHMRDRLRRWLARHGQPADDWLLVANELCTNSMAVSTDPIEIIMTLDAGEVVLEVTDTGPGFVLDIVNPLTTSTRRRGLWIVDQLTHRLAVAHRQGRTTVIAARTLAG